MKLGPVLLGAFIVGAFIILAVVLTRKPPKTVSTEPTTEAQSLSPTSIDTLKASTQQITSEVTAMETGMDQTKDADTIRLFNQQLSDLQNAVNNLAGAFTPNVRTVS